VIPLVRTVPDREPLHGVRQIVRFNWPFYALAVSVIAAAFLTHRMDSSLPIRGLAFAAAGLASLWTMGSLLASWTVYDRSPLMNGGWLSAALGLRPRSWINIHAGLDETTRFLQTLFPGAHGRVFDIFEPAETMEPSIRRARRLGQAALASESVDFRHLPATDATTDAVMLLLSAHELRSDDTRCALLREVRRILTKRGRAIVAEHLRDAANFAAFGPGFLHFHSRRTWMRCFDRAGFAVHDEFSITPFVRVFVLEKAR
jgi:hypothetical protein